MAARPPTPWRPVSHCLDGGGRGNPQPAYHNRHPLAALLALSLVACSPDAATTTPPHRWETWHVPTAGPSQPAPRSVTALPDGGIAALDTAGRVLVYAPDGSIARLWEMPEHTVGKPEGITALADGRIVVCDTHYHRIMFFTPAGQTDLIIGEEGDAPGQFRYPVAIVQAPDSVIYIAEYGGNDRIQAFSTEGEFLRTFATFGTGPGQLQRPAGLAYLDDTLYVADAVNARISAFDPDGTFLHVLGGQALQLHLPYDVCATPDGLLHVLEYGGGRLTTLRPDGTILATYGTTGRGQGQLATPWGMAAPLSTASPLTIADTGNRRLLRLHFQN
jgi:iron(III) transport system ATP-binding protein